MRGLSHQSSSTSASFTASRILEEGDSFRGHALAMVAAVETQHSEDPLQQTRHLNNLLVQVRLHVHCNVYSNAAPSPYTTRVLGNHSSNRLMIT